MATQVIAKKEPWQMTKTEFKEIMEGDRELGLINQYMDETKQKAPTESDFERIRGEVAQKHPKEWQQIQRDKELKRAIYDSLPKEVKRHFGINELDESHHEAFVGQALSEGKPVPREVLKDYPDLTKETKPRKEPWEMTQKEFVSQRESETREGYAGHQGLAPKLDESWRERTGGAHEQLVEDAVSEGKPVPTNVLADYPDLKAPQTSTTKQPWEMTQKEYAQYMSDTFEPIIHGQVVGKKVRWHGTSEKAIAKQKADMLRSVPEHHRYSIKQALASGKPVPAEVLKDYPELKPTAEVAGKWTGYSVTERVMKQLGLDRHDAVTIERALNKFKSAEDFARASGGSPASLATWAYDTITESGRYKTVRDIEAAIAEGLGNVRVTSGEFWESIPRASPPTKPKAEAPAKGEGKIPIDYYDTLAAYYKAHGITEKSLPDKTETKGIEKKRTDLVNELLRRAEVHEKLPVGVASTEKGIRQHVDNMSDRFVEDWHSTIFRKSKPHKEIRVLQAKPSIANVQDKRSARAVAIDRALLAKHVVPADKVTVWAKHPNRYDIRGVDTPSHGRILPGVGYADTGKKRMSRKHHKGFKKVRFT